MDWIRLDWIASLDRIRLDCLSYIYCHLLCDSVSAFLTIYKKACLYYEVRIVILSLLPLQVFSQYSVTPLSGLGLGLGLGLGSKSFLNIRLLLFLGRPSS